MRNRDYKEFAPDTYYHVFNRGVAKRDIFIDNQDYQFFLHRLKENLMPNLSRGTLLYSGESLRGLKRQEYPRKVLPPGSFDLVCYCLMPNHFHFLIRQNRKISVGKLISKVCTSYSMYFNKKYERIGALFQDTFKAVPIENNDYLFWLSLYIHQNPVEAKLVDEAHKWFWSSCLDYTGDRDGILCQKDIILEQLNQSKNYAKFLQKSSDKRLSRVPLLD